MKYIINDLLLPMAAGSVLGVLLCAALRALGVEFPL